jgi:hypothetical protein
MPLGRRQRISQVSETTMLGAEKVMAMNAVKASKASRRMRFCLNFIHQIAVQRTPEKASTSEALLTSLTRGNELVVASGEVSPVFCWRAGKA